METQELTPEEKKRHEILAHKSAKRVASSKNKTRTIRTCLKHLILSI